MDAVLADNLGSHVFSLSVGGGKYSARRKHSRKRHQYLGGKTLCLGDYFTDGDGDALSYAIADVQEGIEV